MPNLAGSLYAAISGERLPETILACGTPVGIAPTGTMAANGAVTLGTPLDVALNNGLWMYFPAGAVYGASAAGFYWTVMSSTTVGTVYMDTYVPGTSSFDIPASPTAVVEPVAPGAFTGSTSEVTAFAAPIPAGFLGKRGYVETDEIAVVTNNANTKTVRMSLDSTSLGVTNPLSVTTNRYQSRMQNAGAVNRQGFHWEMGMRATASTSGFQPLATVDTSAATTFKLIIGHTTATDSIMLRNVRIEATPV